MKKNQFFKFVFTVIFICSISSLVHAVDFKNDKYWIDAGFGNYYSTDNTEGISWNLAVNLINNNTLYKIRFLNHQEFKLFGPDPLEDFYNLGMMMGKGFSGKYHEIQVSGGLGITGGVNRGKLLYVEPSQGWFNISNPNHYEKEKFITPSIPLEIDLIIKPIKFLGAGATLFGDLNYKKPMYGFLIKFALGKLR